MLPLRKLRILACTKPRRLPGVRCATLKTECNSLLNLITIPGRICVDVIMKIPDMKLNYQYSEREAESLLLGPTSPSRYTLDDRKSTRLNSSHVEISYAVFCLKKKKK